MFISQDTLDIKAMRECKRSLMHLVLHRPFNPQGFPPLPELDALTMAELEAMEDALAGDLRRALRQGRFEENGDHAILKVLLGACERAKNRNLVDPGMACPRCGERDKDHLVWTNDDTDFLRCTSCGFEYDADDPIKSLGTAQGMYANRVAQLASRWSGWEMRYAHEQVDKHLAWVKRAFMEKVSAADAGERLCRKVWSLQGGEADPYP